MNELKTKVTKLSVSDFLKSLGDEAKRKESLALLKFFQKLPEKKQSFGVYKYAQNRKTTDLWRLPFRGASGS